MKDGIQIVVEHSIPRLHEEFCSFGRPLHLLSLGEALADYLMDRRLPPRRCDRILSAIVFTECRGERMVVTNVSVKTRWAKGASS